MRVVSNTSPITNLAAVGYLPVLEKLYGQITVPEEVRDELVLGGHGNNPGAHEIVSEPWFVIESVTAQERDRLVQTYPDLDSGEAAALVLAVIRSADLVLLDDKAARQAATALHLRRVGVVGILLAAKTAGLVPLVKPILDDLRVEVGFRLAEVTYLDALRQAGELV